MPAWELTPYMRCPKCSGEMINATSLSDSHEHFCCTECPHRVTGGPVDPGHQAQARAEFEKLCADMRRQDEIDGV